MSQFSLDNSSLIDANFLKDQTLSTEAGVINKRFEEVRRPPADPLIKAQRQEAKLQRDIRMRELSDKTAAAKERLDKLMSGTTGPKKFFDQILASIEVLKGLDHDFHLTI